MDNWFMLRLAMYGEPDSGGCIPIREIHRLVGQATRGVTATGQESLPTPQEYYFSSHWDASDSGDLITIFHGDVTHLISLKKQL